MPLIIVVQVLVGKVWSISVAKNALNIFLTVAKNVLEISTYIHKINLLNGGTSADYGLLVFVHFDNHIRKSIFKKACIRKNELTSLNEVGLFLYWHQMLHQPFK